MALAMLGGARPSDPRRAGEIDLTRAVVVVPDGLSGPEEKAVHVLVEEVRARSGIAWDVMLRWPSGAVPVVAVGPARLLREETSPMRKHIPPRPAAGDAREGYWLRTIDDARGPRCPDGPGGRQRCPRRPLRRRPPAAIAADEARQGGAARSDRAGLVAEVSAPRPSARLPAQDQLLRRLGPAAVGALHPRPGALRHQRHRADPAPLGRRRR